jgi:hypothetical protein
MRTGACDRGAMEDTLQTEHDIHPTVTLDTPPKHGHRSLRNNAGSLAKRFNAPQLLRAASACVQST